MANALKCYANESSTYVHVEDSVHTEGSVLPIFVEGEGYHKLSQAAQTS